MNEKERLSYEIDKCLNGQLSWMDSIMIMRNTPKLLQKCGLNNKPILFSQRHLRNCLHKKGKNIHWHGLKKIDILEMLDWLNTPAMIMDSISDDMSIVVVSNKVDSDCLPIMASIRSNGTGSYCLQTIESNYLTSVYGRNNFLNFFERNIKSDYIMYVNKEKTQELESLCKLHLLAKCSILELNEIIHKSLNIVN